jgi:hypothetical protein
MTRIFTALICLVLLSSSAFAFEVQQVKVQGKTITNQLDELSSERMAQTSLPIAKGEFWDKLFKCKILFDNKTHLYSVKMTDEIKALDGKIVQIQGFMYPLSMEEKQTHILLSKRTPVCFFCPPGEPNEILDVQLAKPTELNSDLVTIEGRFSLMDQKEEGIFFALKDAKVVK